MATPDDLPALAALRWASIPFYRRAGFTPSEDNMQLVLRAYDA